MTVAIALLYEDPKSSVSIIKVPEILIGCYVRVIEDYYSLGSSVKAGMLGVVKEALSITTYHGESMRMLRVDFDAGFTAVASPKILTKAL